jgi:Ca-activated chloride channel family protein
MIVEMAHPWALALLPLIPLRFAFRNRRHGGEAIVFSRAPTLAGLGSRGAAVLGVLPEALRALALASLVIALAGPRTGARVVEENAEGIAIMVAMDVSSSMLAEDFQPGNRLGAAKQTVSRFVQGRSHDRIGLVAFAAEALTQVPATVDYGVLTAALDNLQVGQLEDGTAIGLGLATAANRLRHTEGRSKVIILMSDGENNRGDVDPRDAARAAAAYGIRVFTIGVGSKGTARIPVARTPTGLRHGVVKVSVDEPLLRDVATATGGRYFRATDTRALRRIYDEIDRLVKTKVEVRRYVRFTERYLPFLLLGAALVALEWCFRATRWGRVP